MSATKKEYKLKEVENNPIHLCHITAIDSNDKHICLYSGNDFWECYNLYMELKRNAVCYGIKALWKNIGRD